MEMEKLRAVLIKYGVPFDLWKPDLQTKILRHLNAGKVEIYKLGDIPFCRTTFAIVDVQHQINDTLMH